MRVVTFTWLSRADDIHILDTFPRLIFLEEEYYEDGGFLEGSNADYGYPEEGHPEEEYADEGYGYAS